MTEDEMKKLIEAAHAYRSGEDECIACGGQKVVAAKFCDDCLQYQSECKDAERLRRRRAYFAIGRNG